MKKGTISNGYILRSPSRRLRDEIIMAFSFENPQYEAVLKYSPYSKVSESIPRFIEFAEYNEDADTLFVPRGINPRLTLTDKAYKEWCAYKFKDKRTRFPVEFPKLLIKLNHDQRTLLKAFRNARKKAARPAGNLLWVAPTSAGKTIAQAVLSAKTGQRTLVICLTNLIRDAWHRDIYTAFGIPKRDVGLIQQSTWKIGDHFTLASIATLQRRKNRWKELFCAFGNVVLDEAHSITEPRLQEFLLAARTKYIQGATATPDHEDSSNHTLYTIMGKPVKKIKSKGNVDTESSMALRRARVVKTDFTYEYDPNNLDVHDMALTLAADEERNALIVEEAYKDWKAGHSVVIAVKRVPHIHLLHEMLLDRGVKDANVLYGDTNAKKRYTETLIKALLSRKVRMLVANAQSIKLGGNINPLNRMHLAWPVRKLDLEQLIGRLRRRDPLKRDSELIYYYDHRVQYLRRKFLTKAIPVFREAKLPGFENLFVA